MIFLQGNLLLWRHHPNQILHRWVKLSKRNLLANPQPKKPHHPKKLENLSSKQSYCGNAINGKQSRVIG